MKLKSRDKFIPGEFQAIHPEAGQTAPWKGSFSEIVRKELDFRSRNPALVEKNGWSLDPDDVADDIDRYNAHRMVAAGYLNFVDLEGESPVQKKTGLMGKLRNAANAVGNIKTALAIYRDLFGPDGKVIAKEEAERRASVCVACPKNDVTGGLTKYFVKETARELMLVAGMLKDMDVSTSLDDKLGVCQACECPLRAKIFVRNDILKKHIKSDQVAKLHESCWIPAAIV